MKICCILNEKAGSADLAGRDIVVDLFSKHGVSVNIYETREGNSVSDLASLAVRQKFDIIVAGGGDGTINAVATALIGHPSARLAILPLGTLNHFARDLDIPFDVSRAIEIICAGHSKSVDVGIVNDCYFLNNSSVGLYPAIVRLRESLQSAGYSKWLAALLSSLRILVKFRRFDLEVQPSDGPFIKRKTPLLFVGNNAYETALTKLGRRTTIDRGRLWISLPISQTRMGFILGLVALVFQREKTTDTLIFEATSLKVSSKKRHLTVATDGEIVHLKPPLNYRMLPRALNVLVPVPQSEA